MKRIIVTGFTWLDRKYSRFTWMVAMFSGLTILTMLGIILKEILFRNLGMPSGWSWEMALIMVSWVFLLPAAYSQLNGGMIRITFLINKMPPKVQPWVNLLGSFSPIVFGSLLVMASLDYASRVSPGSYFILTHFPTIVQREIVSVAAALLVVAGVICFGRDILLLKSRPPEQRSLEVNKPGESI